MAKATDKIKEITERLLLMMGVTGDIEVTEGEKSVSVDISNTDSGLLIGYKGETLKALQYIIRILSFSELGEDAPSVVVDIDGYRKSEEERLRSYILKMAELVKKTGQSESLGPASSYKRRLIHMFVSEVPGVASESEGEGPDRHIVIKPQE